MEAPSTPGGGSTSASFRESDIEYLQTQAREWLEAVLDEKLDAQASLQDILADGSVLYRVSLLIRDDLGKVTGHVDTSPLPAVAASPGDARKNSLKYQPYPYVEAFLKVSKDVGLLDVDLFNPSDAVDKKDIRHVCVCLRRLSKKARTLGIAVPDFDNVKHTLTTPLQRHAMPTETVHSLRDSLQQSSSAPSNKAVAGALREVSKETASSIAELRREDPDLDSVSLEPAGDAATFDDVHQKLDEAAAKRAPIVAGHNYTVKVAEPGVDTLPSVLEAAGKKKQDTAEQNSAAAAAGKADAKAAANRAGAATRDAAASMASKLQEKPPAKFSGDGQKGQFIAKPAAPERNGGSAPGGDGKEPRRGAFPWLSAVGGGLALLGTALAAVMVVKDGRGPSLPWSSSSSSSSVSSDLYEVQPGDTLSGISRRSGKSGWQEIYQSNPHIQNPDLIYPSERLKL